MALAPYGYEDADGKWLGNFLELSRAILKEGNFEGYAEVVPVRRVLKLGHTDCAITADVERMQDNFTRVAHMGLYMDFGVLPLKSVPLKKYTDLKDVIIAVPVGSNMGMPFDGDNSLEKVEVQNYASAMQMLNRGRVEAAVGVINSLRFSALISGVDPNQFGDPLVFKTRNIIFYCHPESKSKPYWNEIEAAIKRMYAKGITESIMDKYR